MKQGTCSRMWFGEGGDGWAKLIGIKNRTCISIIEVSEKSNMRFGIANLTGPIRSPYHHLLLP